MKLIMNPGKKAKESKVVGEWGLTYKQQEKIKQSFFYQNKRNK